MPGDQRPNGHDTPGALGHDPPWTPPNPEHTCPVDPEEAP